MSSVSGSSSVTSLYKSLGISSNKIGGLLSGLDTDSIVDALTAGTRAKIAKQNQQRQLLSWQQTAYRSTATTLKNFQSKFFTLSGSSAAGSTSVASDVFWRAFTGNSSNSAKVTANTSTSTSAGTVKISEVKQLATAQTITVNETFSSELTGSGVNLANQSFYGKTLQISVGSDVRTIRLDDLDYVSTAGNFQQNFQDKLQSLIDDAVGRRSPNTGETADADGKVSIVKATLNVDASDASGNTFNINLASENDRVTVQADSSVLGLTKNQTNRANLSTKLKDIDTFNNITDDKVSFKINGTTIELDMKTDTLSSMMTKINRSSAGVNMTYSNQTEQFTFTASKTGAGNNIDIEDVSGKFMYEFIGARGSSSITSSTTSGFMGYLDSLNSTGTFTLNDIDTFLKANAGKSYALTLTIDGVTKTLAIDNVPVGVEIVTGDPTQGHTYNGKTAHEYFFDELNSQITSEFGSGTGVSFSYAATGSNSDCILSLSTPNKTAVTIEPTVLSGGQIDLLDPANGFLTSAGPLFTTGTKSDLGNSGSTQLTNIFGGTFATDGGAFTIRDKNGADVTIYWGEKYDGVSLGGANDVYAGSHLRDFVETVNTAYDSSRSRDVFTYDETKNTFSFDMGNNPLAFKDSTTPGDIGAMQALFGISQYSGVPQTGLATNVQGQNAEVVINGRVITSSTNNFVHDGVGFEVHEEHSASDPAIVITTKGDTDGLVEKIKGFVEEYNTLITALNTLINEEKVSGYTPLTDEQKEEMTVEQITTWETEAKKGLLRNDSTLRRIISDLRTTMTKNVEAAGLSLYDVGIEVESYTNMSSYKNTGKLTIKEDRLRDALENNLDNVRILFTDGFTSYDEDNVGGGIATSLNTIINKAVRENSTKPGSLVAIAGSATTTYTSTIGSKLTRIDEYVTKLKARLKSEYERHWSKFSALETSLQKLSAQSSWLTDMSA